MTYFKYFVFLLISFFCIWSQGQNLNKKRTTRLSFEDELIQGDVSSPDLLFILKSKNPNYGRLLKLRENFLPELRDTRYEVLRGGK